MIEITEKDRARMRAHKMLCIHGHIGHQWRRIVKPSNGQVSYLCRRCGFVRPMSGVVAIAGWVK